MESIVEFEKIQNVYFKAVSKCDEISVFLNEELLSPLTVALALLTLLIALLGVFSDIKKDPNKKGFALSNIKPIGYFVALAMVASGIGNYVLSSTSDKYKERASCQIRAREDLNSQTIKRVNSLVNNVDFKASNISQVTEKISKVTDNVEEQTKNLSKETKILTASTKDINAGVESIDANIESLKSATIAIRSDSEQLKSMIEKTNELALREYNENLLKSYTLELKSIDASSECQRYKNNKIYWQLFAEGQKLSGREPKYAVQTYGNKYVVTDSKQISVFKTGANPSFSFNGYGEPRIQLRSSPLLVKR